MLDIWLETSNQSKSAESTIRTTRNTKIIWWQKLGGKLNSLLILPSKEVSIYMHFDSMISFNDVTDLSIDFGLNYRL